VDKKSIVELVGIYIILLGLSYAFYIVLVAVKANDSIASSLLSWTATMFATIALLYTFNSWRDQKGSEVLSKIAEDIFIKLNESRKIHDLIYRKHADNVLDITLNKTDIKRDISLEVKVKELDENMQLILEKVYLIYKESKNQKLIDKFNETYSSYIKYKILVDNFYDNMKILVHTDTEFKAVIFDKNDRKECEEHININRETSIKFIKSIEPFAEVLLDYIFYRN